MFSFLLSVEKPKYKRKKTIKKISEIFSNITCILYFADDTYSDDKSFKSGTMKVKRTENEESNEKNGNGIHFANATEKKENCRRRVSCVMLRDRISRKSGIEKRKRKPRFILRMRKYSGRCLLFCY